MQKIIRGYTFDYTVAIPVQTMELHWKKPFLDATFTCSSTVSLTGTPTMALAKNWWVSYVQVIQQDGIALTYSDGSSYRIKPFAGVRPKDMDATQWNKISHDMTLFDVRPTSTQQLLKTTPKEKASATVSFADSPALDTSKHYQEYRGVAPTGGTLQAGLTSPHVPSATLVEVSGKTNFALWLVVMMNPTMGVVPEGMEFVFDGVSATPIGPQNAGEFHALYFIEWEVDWYSTVTNGSLTGRGAGMEVLKQSPGDGGKVPTFGSSAPATARMGIEKLT